jgi:hypothetical protein
MSCFEMTLAMRTSYQEMINHVFAYQALRFNGLAHVSDMSHAGHTRGIDGFCQSEQSLRSF